MTKRARQGEDALGMPSTNAEDDNLGIALQATRRSKGARRGPMITQSAAQLTYIHQVYRIPYHTRIPALFNIGPLAHADHDQPERAIQSDVRRGAPTPFPMPHPFHSKGPRLSLAATHTLPTLTHTATEPQHRHSETRRKTEQMQQRKMHKDLTNTACLSDGVGSSDTAPI